MPLIASKVNSSAHGLGWSSTPKGLYPFSTHTFTAAGATGVSGPTYSQALAAYSSKPWASNTNFFQVSGGIQQWVAPANGVYELEVGGASGGTHLYAASIPLQYNKTFGALLIARITFTEGQVVKLLVGQEGRPSTYSDPTEGDNAAPGGGGASWVYYDATDTFPLIVAGGGGGGNRQSYNGNGVFDSTSGATAQSLSNGGTGGNGGQPNNGGSSYWAGGGAGWLTDGTGGNQSAANNRTPGSQGAQGGQSPRNGGLGGTRWNDGTDSGGDGGFGGGGGGGSDNMGTGGGGGYSGGGGGRYQIGNDGGGGGGSYIGAALTEQSRAVRTTHGDGYIKITKI